jgi:hypothetical protein
LPVNNVIQPTTTATLERPLSQVLSQAELNVQPSFQPIVQAQQQWQAAMAALSQLLQDTLRPAAEVRQGLILTGPAPVITCPGLLARLHAWVFSPTIVHQQLLPALGMETAATVPASANPQAVPLLPGDPIAEEQFCLVLTPKFSLVFVLGAVDDQGQTTFQFSFSPDVVDQCYQNLRCRLSLTRPNLGSALDQLLVAYPPLPPDYPTMLQFSHRILQAATQRPVDLCSASAVSLGGAAPRPFATVNPESTGGLGQGLDLELLQAIAHEVRTPLATIKTLTQLLLKRIDLPKDVLGRLEAISRECAEQIDRFSLIFRAAELETAACTTPMPAMASVSLADIFTEGIPRWQKQAGRRHLTLELLLPNQLPAVKSDPTLLDQVLTGLIEHTTHRLPMGSHIQIEVTLAGSQLKLQVRSPQPSEPEAIYPLPLKSVGQVLMVQPETGNLSLSLPVTKNLFQVLGGKLTVRQRAQQEEILTLFLPLGG